MKTVLKVITIILAALGVLFIIIMFLPDDEEKEEGGQDTAVTVQADGSLSEAGEGGNGTEANGQAGGNAAGADADNAIAQAADDTSENNESQQAADDTSEATAATASAETAVNEADEQAATASAETAANVADGTAANEKEDSAETGGNLVQVSIPASEVSDNTMRFRTISLDEKQITQDIFSGYDLTVVHVWGTYCGPCIAEMGDYAKFYDELPDNVNLVGVICDVYDGIDNNVKAADKILSDAGAGFMNLRTSDDLYDIVGEFRYVPSSFFVDKEGHIIGELMDGASFSDMKSRLDGYLK